LLLEQGQPAAAAQAPQSKRGRSQGRDAPRNEGDAPRNEGSLDAEAERRLPGTHLHGWIRAEFVRAPPLHPFLGSGAGMSCPFRRGAGSPLSIRPASWSA